MKRNTDSIETLQSAYDGILKEYTDAVARKAEITSLVRHLNKQLNAVHTQIIKARARAAE